MAALVKEEIANPGSTDGNPIVLPQFQKDDIYPTFKKYFNANAQKAFAVKAHQLVHQRNRMIINDGLGDLLRKLDLKSCKDIKGGIYIRECDLVFFCGSRTDKATIYRGVEKVIATVNHLADQGFITAVMVELSVIRFQPVAPRIEPEYCVISYIALNGAGQVYAKTMLPKMFIEEGGVPERFEDQ
jgi:hypothetical protein